jgi:hypothetical protein
MPSKLSKPRRFKVAQQIDDIRLFFNDGKRWIKGTLFKDADGRALDTSEKEEGETTRAFIRRARACFRDGLGVDTPFRIDGTVMVEAEPVFGCLLGAVVLTLEERISDVMADLDHWGTVNAGEPVFSTNYSGTPATRAILLAAREVTGRNHMSIPDFNDHRDTDWPLVEKVLLEAKRMVLAGEVG